MASSACYGHPHIGRVLGRETCINWFGISGIEDLGNLGSWEGSTETHRRREQYLRLSLEA
jgi:hypothetical protein